MKGQGEPAGALGTGKADRGCRGRGPDPQSGVAAGLRLWGPEALKTVRVKVHSGREGF